MDILIYVLTGSLAVSLGHHWCESELTTAVVLHELASYKPLDSHFKLTGSVYVMLKRCRNGCHITVICIKLNHIDRQNITIWVPIHFGIFMKSEIFFPFKEKKDLCVTRNRST